MDAEILLGGQPVTALTMTHTGAVPVQVSNCMDYSGNTVNWPYVHYYYTPSEPVICTGKAHVFECEHVKHCKCGAIVRVMSKPKKARR